MLEALLRALHPMMPFITEEIWQRVHPLAAPLTRRGRMRRANHETVDSLMLARLPGRPPTSRATRRPRAQVAWIKEFILEVRQIRGEMDIAPSRKIPLLLRERRRAGAMRHWPTNMAPICTRLAGLESVKVLDAGETAPVSASAMVGEHHAAGAHGGPDRSRRPRSTV